MQILNEIARHARALNWLKRVRENNIDDPVKVICIVVDAPDTFQFARQASWVSDFNDHDTHLIMKALAEQTRP